MERQKEGIILRVTPYQDRHEIASIFTPDGKISLIRKWGRSSKKSPLSPMTRCDFFYETGKGEMGTLKDYHMTDHFLSNREDYEALTFSMECLKAIEITQQGESPSEPLYRLLLKVLSKLPTFDKKQNLISLFYLKILLQEGLIPLETLDLEMAELVLITSLEILSKKNYPESFHKKIKALFKEST